MKKKSKVYEFSEETILKRKIAITIGVIVSIVAIVVGVIFFIQDNNTEYENPSENISQNGVDTQEENSQEGELETSEKTGEIADKEVTIDRDITVTTVMKETIDLSFVDLTKYGLTKDTEISIPYPTLLGCVYVVRDYGKAEEQTYLFVTTQDNVMYLNTEFPSAGRMPLTGTYSYGTYSLKTCDLDGQKGEEIVLLANTGGNGGAGIYCNGIYKISNGKIAEMKISNAEPFTVNLEAPYTVVFKNEKLDYEEKIVCNSDYESLFDDNGNPEVNEYDGGFYSPHEVEVYCHDEEKPRVSFKSWSYLSRSMNDDEVHSTVEYIYDAKTNKFVIADAWVSAWNPEDDNVYESEEEYFEILTHSNGYTYYDINKDGVKELITHTGTCEADRIYSVYTFKNGKMYCVGEINGWHGTMYAKDKSIVVVSVGALENGTVVEIVTYELVGNKLVEKDVFEKEFTDDKELDKYFDIFDKTAKEIKINNLYYR